MSDEKYFNFPIQLLDDFLLNSNKVLNDICDYAIYAQFLKMEYGNKLEKLKACEKYFNLKLGNSTDSYLNGKQLHEKNEKYLVKVGINLSIFWDFFKNHKSEFEKICLLAFLAIKSILQQKAYCKIDNRFLFARMSGRSKSCEFVDLPEYLKKYTKPYQARKIKSELVDNWRLVTYSHYTRGFYVSFKLKLEELVFQAEKRRKSTIEKEKNKKKKLAIQKALLRLKQLES